MKDFEKRQLLIGEYYSLWRISNELNELLGKIKREGEECLKEQRLVLNSLQRNHIERINILNNIDVEFEPIIIEFKHPEGLIRRTP